MKAEGGGRLEKAEEEKEEEEEDDDRQADTESMKQGNNTREKGECNS